MARLTPEEQRRREEEEERLSFLDALAKWMSRERPAAPAPPALPRPPIAEQRSPLPPPPAQRAPQEVPPQLLRAEEIEIPPAPRPGLFADEPAPPAPPAPRPAVEVSVAPEERPDTRTPAIAPTAAPPPTRPLQTPRTLSAWQEPAYDPLSSLRPPGTILERTPGALAYDPLSSLRRPGEIASLASAARSAVEVEVPPEDRPDTGPAALAAAAQAQPPTAPAPTPPVWTPPEYEPEFYETAPTRPVTPGRLGDLLRQQPAYQYVMQGVEERAREPKGEWRFWDELVDALDPRQRTPSDWLRLVTGFPAYVAGELGLSGLQYGLENTNIGQLLNQWTGKAYGQEQWGWPEWLPDDALGMMTAGELLFDMPSRTVFTTPVDQLVDVVKGELEVDEEGNALPGQYLSIAQAAAPVGTTANYSINPWMWVRRLEGKEGEAWQQPWLKERGPLTPPWQEPEFKQRMVEWGLAEYDEQGNIVKPRWVTWMGMWVVDQWNQALAFNQHLRQLPPEERAQALFALNNSYSGINAVQDLATYLQAHEHQIALLKRLRDEAAASADPTVADDAAMLDARLRYLESLTPRQIMDQEHMHIPSELMWGFFDVTDPLLDPVLTKLGHRHRAQQFAQKTVLEPTVEQAGEALVDAVRAAGLIDDAALEGKTAAQVVAEALGGKPGQSWWDLEWLPGFGRIPTELAMQDTDLLTKALNYIFAPAYTIEDAQRLLSYLIDHPDQLLGGLPANLFSPQMRQALRVDPDSPTIQWGPGLLHEGWAYVQPILADAGDDLFKARALQPPEGQTIYTAPFDHNDFKAEAADILYEHAAAYHGYEPPQGRTPQNPVTWLLELLAQGTKAWYNFWYLSTPRNSIKNAVTALTSAWGLDRLSLTPNEVIQQDYFRLFGGPPTTDDAGAKVWQPGAPSFRIGEATGQPTPAGMPRQGALGFLQLDQNWINRLLESRPVSFLSLGLSKLGSYAQKWMIGKTYGTGEIPLGPGLRLPWGEQSHYMHIHHDGLLKHLNNVWGNVIQRQLVPELEAAGIDPEAARKVGDLLHQEGVYTGNRWTLPQTLRQWLGGNVFQPTVFDLGLPPSMPGHLLHNIQQVLMDYAGVDDPQLVRQAMEEINGQIAKAWDYWLQQYWKAAPEFGTTLRPTHRSALEMALSLFDELANSARQAGDQAPPNAQAEAKALSAEYYRAYVDAVNHFAQELVQTPSGPNTWGVALDFFHDLWEHLFDTRRQVDALGREAAMKNTPDAWAHKWQETARLWDEHISWIKGMGTDSRQTLIDVQSGVDYRPAWDWTEVLKRWIFWDETAYAEAREAGRALGSPADITQWQLFEQVRDANRERVDISFITNLEIFKQFPTVDNFDLLLESLRNAEIAGRGAASYLAELRAQGVKGAAYAAERWTAWNKLWVDAVVEANEAYGKTMVVNGIGSTLSWAEGADRWTVVGVLPDGRVLARRSRDGAREVFHRPQAGEPAGAFTLPEEIAQRLDEYAREGDSAVERIWAEVQKRLPKVEREWIPPDAYVGIPAEDAARLRQQVIDVEGEELGDALWAILEARANVWAMQTGRPAIEWFGSHLAGYVAGGEAYEIPGKPGVVAGGDILNYPESGISIIRIFDPPPMSVDIDGQVYTVEGPSAPVVSFHEVGHLFLWDLGQVARDMPEGPARQQALKDLERAARWTGAGKQAYADPYDPRTWPNYAHEKWANGFVTYLRTGKAPDPGLKGVFRRARTWITEIYRTLKGDGQYPVLPRLSPQVREVYDRLLVGPHPQPVPAAPPAPAAAPPAPLGERVQEFVGSLIPDEWGPLFTGEAYPPGAGPAPYRPYGPPPWPQTGAGAGAATAPAQAPTDTELRKLAQEAGIATATERGVGFDNWLLNFVRKHTGVDLAQLRDATPEQRWQIWDALLRRAGLPSPEGAERLAGGWSRPALFDLEQFLPLFGTEPEAPPPAAAEALQPPHVPPAEPAPAEPQFAVPKGGGQMGMFGTGEDLPLLSGTPYGSSETTPFAPQEAVRQEGLFDLRPSLGAAEPSYAPQVAPELPPAAPELPPGGPGRGQPLGPRQRVAVTPERKALPGRLGELFEDLEVTRELLDELTRAWDQEAVGHWDVPPLEMLYLQYGGGKGDTVNLSRLHDVWSRFEDIQGITVGGYTINSLDDLWDLLNDYAALRARSTEIQGELRQAGRYSKLSPAEIVDYTRGLLTQAGFTDEDLARLAEQPREVVLEMVANVEQTLGLHPETGPGEPAYFFAFRPTVAQLLGADPASPEPLWKQLWTNLFYDNASQGARPPTPGGVASEVLDQYQYSQSRLTGWGRSHWFDGIDPGPAPTPPQAGPDVAPVKKTVRPLSDADLPYLQQLLAPTENPITPEEMQTITDVADKYIPQYDSALTYAEYLATKDADWAMLNFADRRDIDVWLARYIPYHYFWTRMPSRVLDFILSRPRYANLVFETTRARERLDEQREYTDTRMEGTMPNPLYALAEEFAPGFTAFVPPELRVSAVEVSPLSQYVAPNPFIDPAESVTETERMVKNVQSWTPQPFFYWQYAQNWLMDRIWPRSDGTKRTSEFQLQDLLPVPAAAAVQWATGQIPDVGLFGADENDAGRAGREAAVLGAKRYAELIEQGVPPKEASAQVNALVMAAYQVIQNDATGRPREENVPPALYQQASQLAEQATRTAGRNTFVNRVAGVLTAMGGARMDPEEEALRQLSQLYGELGYDPYFQRYGSKAAQGEFLDRNQLAQLLPSYWERNVLWAFTPEGTPGTKARDVLVRSETDAVMEAMNQHVEEYVQAAQAEGRTPTEQEIYALKEPYFERAEAIEQRHGVTEAPAFAPTDTPEERQEKFRAQQEETLKYLPTRRGRTWEELALVKIEAAYRYATDAQNFGGRPEYPGEGAPGEALQAYYVRKAAYDEARLKWLDRTLRQLMTQEEPYTEDVRTAAERLLGGQYASVALETWQNRFAGPVTQEWARALQLADEIQRYQMQANKANVAEVLGTGGVTALEAYLSAAPEQRQALRDQSPIYGAALEAAYNYPEYRNAAQLFGPDWYQAIWAKPKWPYGERRWADLSEAEQAEYSAQLEAWRAQYPRADEVDLWYNGRSLNPKLEEQVKVRTEPETVLKYGTAFSLRDRGRDYYEAAAIFGPDIFDINRTYNALPKGTGARSSWIKAHPGEYARLKGFWAWDKEFEEVQTFEEWEQIRARGAGLLPAPPAQPEIAPETYAGPRPVGSAFTPLAPLEDPYATAAAGVQTPYSQYLPIAPQGEGAETPLAPEPPPVAAGYDPLESLRYKAEQRARQARQAEAGVTTAPAPDPGTALPAGSPFTGPTPVAAEEPLAAEGLPPELAPAAQAPAPPAPPIGEADPLAAWREAVGQAAQTLDVEALYDTPWAEAERQYWVEQGDLAYPPPESAQWGPYWDQYRALGEDWEAKRQFMLDHPEFAAYYISLYGEDSAWWLDERKGARPRADSQGRPWSEYWDEYFSLPDTAAKAAYLRANPEFAAYYREHYSDGEDWWTDYEERARRYGAYARRYGVGGWSSVDLESPMSARYVPYPASRGPRLDLLRPWQAPDLSPWPRGLGELRPQRRSRVQV